jgi:hypothetical protein
VPAPGPDAPARKGPSLEPAGGAGAAKKGSQIAVGLAVAIAGGLAAIAFMAVSAPASAPGDAQGASAIGGDGLGPGVQLPGSSGNSTSGLPLPSPAPSLPAPSLPSLPPSGPA